MAESLLIVTLAFSVGALLAIMYVLRYVVIVERRIESIEVHIERLVNHVLQEEFIIERMVRGKSSKKIPLKHVKGNVSKKKTSKKKSMKWY